MRQPVFILFVCCIATGASAPTALAADPPPPPTGPAINQYVETIPSGSGGRAVGVGGWQKVTLPKKVQKKITREATPLGSKLRTIATSSEYGAPQETLSRRTRAKPGTSSDGTTRQSEAKPAGNENALAAAASAATDSDSRAPLILLGVIVLLTTAAGIYAAAKRTAGQPR